MKKSLLAIGMACIALSGMAVTQRQPHSSDKISFDRNVVLKTHEGLGIRHKDGMKKTPAKINTSEDVITSVEGTRLDMTLVGSGYDVFDEYVMEYENEQSATHVVYADNDEVYIYNILPTPPVGAYVKGIRKDDKIIVDLPQTVMWNDRYEEGVNVNICERYEIEEDGETYFDYTPVEGESLVFSVADDGSMKADDLDVEHRMLGFTYCTDDYWCGYGVWELSMKPFSDTLVTVPSDIEVSKDSWNYTCGALGYGWTVSFAQGGEEVYFQGLSESIPEAWVKATVEYDDTEAHVYIDQNQYVGAYYGYYVYTKCARIIGDEEEGYEYDLMPDDYRFELVWDYEEETMVPKDPSISLLFNISKDELNFVDELYEFVLSVNDGYEGTPANPYDLKYYDYMEDFNFAVLEFYAPALSVDGDLLDTSNLGYVVYLDNEEWTFDAGEYDLEESMVEIPWSFDNEETILKFFGSCRHAVYLYVEGVSSIGVQSVYRYDGEETHSEIVTLDLKDDPSSSTSLDIDRKVADEKYYDLSGRQVAHPAAGIFVKRVTFEDGSVVTFKKAVR